MRCKMLYTIAIRDLSNEDQDIRKNWKNLIRVAEIEKPEECLKDFRKVKVRKKIGLKVMAQ